MYHVLFLMIFSGLFPKASDHIDPNSTLQKVEAIEVREISPVFGETFYRVFYIDSFVVYQSQYVFDSSISKPETDSATGEVRFNLVLERHEMRNRFFVFHRDSSFGFMYDPRPGCENNLRLPVDSILASIKGTNNFEAIMSNKPDSIMWNHNKTQLREVFAAKPAKDTPAMRIIFHYSKRLNHLKESFNPALDSARKMKLFKFEILMDEYYSEKHKRLWPAMKGSSEMREIRVKNKEEVISFIMLYKQSIALRK